MPWKPTKMSKEERARRRKEYYAREAETPDPGVTVLAGPLTLEASIHANLKAARLALDIRDFGVAKHALEECNADVLLLTEADKVQRYMLQLAQLQGSYDALIRLKKNVTWVPVRHKRPKELEDPGPLQPLYPEKPKGNS